MLCSLQDLSSGTTDETQAFHSESSESQPLDCQGILAQKTIFSAEEIQQEAKWQARIRFISVGHL